jgi:hypothetical protein
LRERAAQDGRPFFAISAVAGTGVRELLTAIAREIEEMRANVNTGGSYHGEESLLVSSSATRF